MTWLRYYSAAHWHTVSVNVNHRYSYSTKNLGNRYMHLTNYSINKQNERYQSNAGNHDCEGHKWYACRGLLCCAYYVTRKTKKNICENIVHILCVFFFHMECFRSLGQLCKNRTFVLMQRLLKTLWEHLDKQGVSTKTIWQKIVDLVIKTVLRYRRWLLVLWHCKHCTISSHKLLRFWPFSLVQSISFHFISVYYHDFSSSTFIYTSICLYSELGTKSSDGVVYGHKWLLRIPGL